MQCVDSYWLPVAQPALFDAEAHGYSLPCTHKCPDPSPLVLVWAACFIRRRSATSLAATPTSAWTRRGGSTRCGVLTSLRIVAHLTVKRKM